MAKIPDVFYMESKNNTLHGKNLERISKTTVREPETTIKKEQGDFTTEEVHEMSRWKEHFEKLLTISCPVYTT